jgi:hypothetical protein
MVSVIRRVVFRLLVLLFLSVACQPALATTPEAPPPENGASAPATSPGVRTAGTGAATAPGNSSETTSSNSPVIFQGIQVSQRHVSIATAAPQETSTPAVVTPVTVIVPAQSASKNAAADTKTGSGKLKLATIVVQTGFSTEPVVLAASDSLYYSKKGGGDKQCQPPQESSNLIDSFCVFGKIYSLHPYYSCTSDQASGGAACEPQSITPGDGAKSVPAVYKVYTGWPKHHGMFLLRSFLQPGATTLSASDQVGINGTPRWSVAFATNPAWSPWEKTGGSGALNYLSASVAVNLNNQVNANANSIIGAILWNVRSRNLLNRKYFRIPGVDITTFGTEYDYISNDVNIYFPSLSGGFPLVVLDHATTPGALVWKMNLGELSGWHIRNPSADLAGKNNQSAKIAKESNQLFRGVAGSSLKLQGWNLMSGFSITSSYQVMLPATVEPYTVSNSASKPPTITLTDKARHYVSVDIGEKLGGSSFSIDVKYQYGSLPPAFWAIKHSLGIAIKYTSGNSSAE